MAFGMLIGIGATSVISIRLGQQKREEAERIVGNAFILLIGISLLITFLGYLFMDQILVSLGASSDVFPYAKQYIVSF
jgi:Na+-driven multidrug efflux pump